MRKWLWIVFLVDILLQGYFRRLGYGTMNKGISFGWWPGISLLATVGVYLVFFGWAISGLRKGDRPVAWWAMILGGLGNLLQRLWLGSVWDYLYFPLLGFWFNLADALITMGVICYIFDENLLPARKR